eukprot:TRINITY_DN6772_c0_g1_i3.p1 TRINITY_DN6772_c0_g1~~TRINITY_DN6772_c0_g1_i3.p1  ORF type:complete len:199 (-),score=24.00 TRINITY_DN6772_c0_g1_i3:385-981(-)
MGCGISLVVPDDLTPSERHSALANQTARPDYLKPISDPKALTPAEFILATRVFLHFDEHETGMLSKARIEKVRDDMLRRKLKNYTDSGTEEALDNALKDRTWAPTVQLCRQSFDGSTFAKAVSRWVNEDPQGGISDTISIREWYLTYENDLQKRTGRIDVTADLNALEHVWIEQQRNAAEGSESGWLSKASSLKAKGL